MAHRNSDICCWPDGPEDCDNDPHGCYPCKLRGWSGGGLQISPAATPNKTRKFHPVGKPKGNNSYERPVVTDSRGMPLMKADGELIRQGDYTQNRRRYETARRDLHNAPPPQ